MAYWGNPWPADPDYYYPPAGLAPPPVRRHRASSHGRLGDQNVNVYLDDLHPELRGRGIERQVGRVADGVDRMAFEASMDRRERERSRWRHHSRDRSWDRDKAVRYHSRPRSPSVGELLRDIERMKEAQGAEEHDKEAKRRWENEVAEKQRKEKELYENLKEKIERDKILEEEKEKQALKDLEAKQAKKKLEEEEKQKEADEKLERELRDSLRRLGHTEAQIDFMIDQKKKDKFALLPAPAPAPWPVPPGGGMVPVPAPGGTVVSTKHLSPSLLDDCHIPYHMNPFDKHQIILDVHLDNYMLQWLCDETAKRRKKQKALDEKKPIPGPLDGIFNRGKHKHHRSKSHVR